MIACSPSTAKIYYRAYGTATSTVDATDDTTSVTVVVVSDSWQEISGEATVWVVSEIKEPAQEPDEPNAGERPVTWERPHRRLATVDRARRNSPRKATSAWG